MIETQYCAGILPQGIYVDRTRSFKFYCYVGYYFQFALTCNVFIETKIYNNWMATLERLANYNYYCFEQTFFDLKYEIT